MAGKAPQARFCSDACKQRDASHRDERDRLAHDAWREENERGRERALALGITDADVALVFEAEITAHAVTGRRNHVTAVAA